jgi:hypothetical protein
MEAAQRAAEAGGHPEAALGRSASEVESAIASAKAASAAAVRGKTIER